MAKQLKLFPEQTNDESSKISSGAIKYDANKAPLFRGAIGYFPRALEQVAAVSAFGASKYAWGGWANVSDGYNRYSDALLRHLIAPDKGEERDEDSGFLHEAHAAWNALARLELKIREMDKS